MKILHIVTGLGKASGVTTFVENVAREQRALGHEVGIVVKKFESLKFEVGSLKLGSLKFEVGSLKFGSLKLGSLKFGGGGASTDADLTQRHRDTEDHGEVFEKGEARGLGCNPSSKNLRESLCLRASVLKPDRRRCAEKKVEEWLAGVDEAAFEAALVKLVEEKSAAGEYVFEKDADIEKGLSAAKDFFKGYSRRIVELSDGRYVYFAPDPRSKLRNNSNAICWAEYAFHAVSSGGDKIPGKDYTYRKFNEYKVINTDLIQPTLAAERCVPVLRRNKPAQDAVKFFGSAHLGGMFDVVVRLDEYGNVNANMTEVTFEASTKRGQKKLPQLVSLTEAIRTVVSHQTATGTYPPNDDSIAFSSDENKGEEGKFEVGMPDVVHIHGLWDLWLTKMARRYRKMGAKIVWSPHGMLTPWALKNKWPKKLVGLLTYQYWELRRADLIHVTAESEVEDVRRLGLKNKIVLAPLGVRVGGKFEVGSLKFEVGGEGRC